MTTYEHVMLGVNGTLALRLHERHGWKIVALAGLAAASPDWDGLTWFVSNEAFGEGHRVWGHNVWACVLLGVAIGILDYRWDLVTRAGRAVSRMLRLKVPGQSLALRATFRPDQRPTWLLVAIVAALSQLPADTVVSGTKALPVWGLKWLWPFSDQSWSCQLVTYNDPGVLVIFVAGMFALAQWPTALTRTARVTLVLVVAYLLFRGFVWHERPFGA